ncbi:transposase [uncultured Phocaeicola sp.]|uniref:transposase n=1 Tax=uncultured Phocaeicola sp. TaxID=990718 RepID=UPI0025A161A2|nr:transposase [uncultured Phocaeicola sp.]
MIWLNYISLLSSYAFICPEGKKLSYHRLNCNQSTEKCLRCYQASREDCLSCHKRNRCSEAFGSRRRVLASTATLLFRRHNRVGTPEYLDIILLREIWAEGGFPVLKREYCLSKIRKRGILAGRRMPPFHQSIKPKSLVKAIFFARMFFQTGTEYEMLDPSLNFLNDPLLYLIWAAGAEQQSGETHIKPFAIDRKNFLFANTLLGAQASAVQSDWIAKETGLGHTLEGCAVPLLRANVPESCATT